jgi:hypothetical protein
MSVQTINYASSAFACYWGLFYIWWQVNFIRHRLNLNFVHRLISTMILLKIAYCVLMTSLFSNSTSYYWQVGVVISFALYNTSTYAAILLLSKGLSITRHVLNRSEAVSLCFHLVFVFIAFSMIRLFPEAAFIVIAVINFSFFKAFRYAKAVKESLLHRIAELRLEMRQISVAIAKAVLIKKLSVAICLFFLAQLVVYLGLMLVVPLFITASADYDGYVHCYLQFSEAVTVTLLCCWFKPKPRMVAAYFSFFSSSRQPFEIPPFYLAQPEVELSDGPIVLVTPDEKTFNVALPVKSN